MNFHLMAKPVGPICNLDCSYCFYLEKEKLYPEQTNWKMSAEVLEQYIQQYIAAQDSSEVSFAWQGGEPTLLGIEFFRRAVQLQSRHAQGKIIHNAIQTNGTLLNDEWCEFLTEHRFLVGLSIDGPAHLHDAYRVDKQKRPTFDHVMKGLRFLQKHRTEFNTLTVVNRKNSAAPLEVYSFLKEIGSQYLQFIPLVERQPQMHLKIRGFDFAEPPDPRVEAAESPAVTESTVLAEDYGEFLVQIFDHWVRHDVGRVFVQLFDVTLGNWVGERSSLCFFSPTCGTALAIEQNGDVYSCDHYVYPKYRLGNILNRSLGELVRLPQQIKFGSDKLDTLPTYCRKCEVRFACNGECPKHRFTRTPDGEAGLNYLCSAYKRFFTYAAPYMRTMAELLRSRHAPAEIMRLLANEDTRKFAAMGSRNSPCPCGSGRKWKNCCGASRSQAHRR